MIQVVPVLVFIFVFLVCMGIHFFYQDHQTLKKEKLIRRAATTCSLKETRRLDLRRRREKGRFEGLVSGLIDVPLVSDLLSRSGLALSLDRFLFLVSVSAAVFALAAILLTRSLYGFIPMVCIGFALPFVVLVVKKKKREAALVDQLPNTLDFIVRALRSGQSLDKALFGVSAHFDDPIGGEMKIVYEEISMGLAFSDALKNFENRFPKLPEVHFLCTSFVIQKETGGNLTEILDALSRTMRERFKLHRQIRSTTAEGRLSMLFLGLAPICFGVAVYISKPDYISILFHDPAGRRLLFVALGLNLLGFVVMRFLTRVDA